MIHNTLFIVTVKKYEDSFIVMYSINQQHLLRYIFYNYTGVIMVPQEL